MGVPYNFLQELSGIGKTTPPFEFDSSSRYIGWNPTNYFFADESANFYSALNLEQKRNANELVFSYVNLKSLSSRRDTQETGNIILKFSKNSFSKGPLETGSISISPSLAVFSFPLETGHIFVSLLSSFTSGINDVCSGGVAFDYNFVESLTEEASGELAFDVFIKKINKEYSSLGLVLSTGIYEGSLFISKNDYSNLNLIIFTGSYQGPTSE